MFVKINGILVGVNPLMNADLGGGGSTGGDDPAGGDDPKAGDDPGEDDPDTDDEDLEQGEDLDKKKQDDAIKAAEKAAYNKVLKNLGLKDVKSGKEMITKLKQLEDQNKTEAQKAADKLNDLTEEHATLSSRNTELELQVAVLKADVKPEAMDDVIILAKNLVSDEVDFEKAVDSVLKKHTYFKKDAVDQDKENKGDNKKPKFSKGDHGKGAQPTEQETWNTNFNWFPGSQQ